MKAPMTDSTKRDIVTGCANELAAASDISFERALDIIQDLLRGAERGVWENCASQWGVVIEELSEADD